MRTLAQRSTAVVGRRALHASSVVAAPATMRAVVVHQTGDASALTTEGAWAVPKPTDGQCLIKNEFAGLNFIDTYHRSGLYPRDLPFIGGQEGAGVVEEVTPKAEAMGLKVGDRVAYNSFFSYAEYTCVPAAKLIPVPDVVGLDVATACVVQGMTAHYLTHSAHADLIAPGEWMLVHGAGGGTCQWAAQMAKIKGYKVIGTAAKGKADIARSTGVDELILLDETPGTAYEDYTSVDITAKVMEITGGEGVKAVVDGIGLATWEISLACLARRGIFVTFGNASGAVPPVTPLKLIGKSAFMCRPKLLDYTVTRDELIWRSSDVFKWIADGRLKVSVDKTFSLDEATDGHLYIEAGKSTGKVLYATS